MESLFIVGKYLIKGIIVIAIIVVIVEILKAIYRAAKRSADERKEGQENLKRDAYDAQFNEYTKEQYREYIKPALRKYIDEKAIFVDNAVVPADFSNPGGKVHTVDLVMITRSAIYMINLQPFPGPVAIGGKPWQPWALYQRQMCVLSEYSFADFKAKYRVQDLPNMVESAQSAVVAFNKNIAERDPVYYEKMLRPCTGNPMVYSVFITNQPIWFDIWSASNGTYWAGQSITEDSFVVGRTEEGIHQALGTTTIEPHGYRKGAPYFVPVTKKYSAEQMQELANIFEGMKRGVMPC